MSVAKRREKFTGVITKNGKLRVRGKRSPFGWGRTAFKLFIKLAITMQWKPKNPKRRKLIREVHEFIEFNQRMFNREDVWFRVFYETGGWFPIKEGDGMFGSPPQDPGVWDIAKLRKIADNIRAGKEDRVKRLTPLGKRTLKMLFSISHRTGACFELVADATLKHTAGLSTPVIDHCIRQLAFECRIFQQQFPNAVVMINVRNEWDAHNQTRTSLAEVNKWGERFYRWKRKNQFKVSFVDPGGGFLPEQWPEGVAIIDHGGRNDIQYKAGTRAGVFQMAAVHLTRGRGWEKIPLDPKIVKKLKEQAHRAPLAITESMYYLNLP